MQKEREQNTIDETEGMQICDKKAQETQTKRHKKHEFIQIICICQKKAVPLHAKLV